MVAKGQAQLQEEADNSRKKLVDAKNKAAAKKIEDDAKKLAGTPLNAEEEAFIARIAPKMNKGRHVEKPCPADITRYARLVKQKGSKKIVDKALGGGKEEEAAQEATVDKAQQLKP